jgi:hypothetical protein
MSNPIYILQVPKRGSATITDFYNYREALKAYDDVKVMLESRGETDLTLEDLIKYDMYEAEIFDRFYKLQEYCEEQNDSDLNRALEKIQGGVYRVTFLYTNSDDIEQEEDVMLTLSACYDFETVHEWYAKRTAEHHQKMLRQQFGQSIEFEIEFVRT